MKQRNQIKRNFSLTLTLIVLALVGIQQQGKAQSCGLIDIPLLGDTAVVCASEANVRLDSSESGVSYFLRDTATNSVVTPSLNGTAGSSISFDLSGQTQTATYQAFTQDPSAALNVDGINDYIVAPATINDSVGSNITIEGWYNIQNLSNYAALIAEAFISDGNIKFTMFSTNGASFSAGFFDGSWKQVNAPMPALNTWVHIAATYDQQFIKIYFDGVEVGSGVQTSALPNGTEEWRLGRRWDAANNLQGQMDEVRIWNIAKSQAQIQNEMSICLTGSEPGLVAYYKCEDGTGSPTLTDNAGNGFDGTLTNMDPATDWVDGIDVCGCEQSMPNYVTVTLEELGSFTLNPQSQLPCVGSDMFLKTDTTGVLDSLLWQVSTDNGTTWNSIILGTGIYSGTADSLQFTGVSLTENNNLYRSIAYKCGNVIDSTSSAALTMSHSSINAFECSNYTAPSGKLIVTGGTHLDTLAGAGLNGCDSIITINLSLYKESAPHHTITPSACIYNTSGGITYSSVGVFYDTIVGGSSMGCDSIIAVNLTPACDTITAYRLIGTTDNGDNEFFNDDSTSFTTSTVNFSRGHAVFENPNDGLLYALIDTVGKTERDLFKLNPFTGGIEFVFDFSDDFMNSADISPEGIVYAIVGNNSLNSGQVFRLDSAMTTETLIATSNVGGGRALEFYPPDTTIRIYEADLDNCYSIDPTTGVENTLTTSGFNASSGGFGSSSVGELHGAYYHESDQTLLITDYAGNIYTTDATGLNGNFLENTGNSGLFDLSEFTMLIAEDTVSICPYDSTLLKVKYTSNRVEWYKDGVMLNHQLDSIFVSSPGIYQVLQEIGTTGKWAMSEEIVVEHHNLPVLTLSTVANDTLLCPGESIQINSGTGGAGFQWFLNGSPIPSTNSNSYVANQIGNYNVTKINQKGCVDSAAVSVVLYESFASSSSITESACDSYLSPSGLMYTSTGIYEDTIVNAVGCDSVITVDLTITNSSSGIDVQSACESLTWIDGNTYTTSNNSATYVVPNAMGCDSLITLDLSINNVDTSIINASPMFTSNAISATYQWIDCDNGNSPIPGETNQSFTAAQNGNYAVSIMQNGCVDTSACYSVIGVGVEDQVDVELMVHPNPTGGLFSIVGYHMSYKITNVSGQLIEYKVNGARSMSSNIDISNQTNGIYFIQIMSEKGMVSKKLIKQ